MAQVKKLNTGGSVQKYKYGKDIRNGVTYDVDEEYMRQLDEYLSKADPEMQNDLAQARNNLMNGKTVTSDSFKNQIDADSMNLTEKQENRASKDYNAFKAGWRGATNNRQHRINKAIQYWNNFKYVKPEEKKEEPEDNRTKLTYGQHAFNYTKDGNNYAYINGPGNASAMEYLSSFKKYFDTADKKTYNVSGWTNNDTLDGLNAWWSALKNPEQYWTGLLDDIKNGRELSADELEALKVMGIGYNRGTAVSTDSENTELSPEEKKRKEKFDKAGWAYDEWKDRGELGDDGSFILNADALGRYGTGNYRFNDYWERDYANPDEMWRRGYVQLGDRLYKESDASKEGTTLYNYLRQKHGFYDLNKVGDYATSDSKLKWLWGNAYYQNHDDTYLGDFYKGIQYDPTNRYQSGSTWKNGTWNNDHQLVEYLDMVNGEVDDFGFRIPQLGIVDKYGRTIAKGLSRDEFTNLYEGGGDEVKKAEQKLKRTERISTDPENPYYNYYSIPVGPEDSRWYTFHINEGYDPKGEDPYAVMELGEILKNKTIGKDIGIKVPKGVVEAMTSAKFRNTFGTDARLQEKMLNTIMSLTGSDWQDIFRGNFDDYEELAKRAGISDNDAKEIVKYFYENGSNRSDSAAWERRNEYTTILPGAYKQGGILKAQQGRVINAGGKDNNTALTSKGETTNHKEHGAFPGSHKLSNADIAELVSVGGDVIGTVAGLFGPIGDIAGSGIGLAASATQFGADISRDGFQLRDLGRFGLNAGLDAVGLLPFLGDAARVAKVASGVKKVSKVLSPLLIGIGAVTAADSVGKVVNGEKLTVQDWSNLAAGFQALTNAGVLGKQRFNKAKIDSLASKMGTDVKMPDYKAKIDKTPVTITAKDFADNINGKSKEQVTKFLIQKAKEAGVADNKMPKDIIKHFGLKSTGVGKWGRVSDPNLPTTQPEKSTFRSFFSNIDKSLDKAATDGRLQKLVDSFNSKRTVINGAGIDVIRVESPEIKNGLSRTLASIASDRGLNVQLTPKSKTRYTRISQLPAGEYAHVHNPKTKEAVLAEATQNINNLPIQSRVIAESLNAPLGVRAKLMPTGPGQQALSDPKTRLRNARNRFRINRELSNISEQELTAVGMMTAPTHTQMLQSLTKGVGQARYTPTGVRTDIDTAIKDTDFSAYNLWKKYPELYGRLTGYRKALQNVNSEASFKKLMDNMRNDVEFQLAMEENPGLLRQDMLNAAARAGLMGSSRKSLVKGMVFKKGGILKAQNGLDMDKVRKDLLDHTLSDLDKDLRINPFGVSTKASTGIETAMQNEQTRAINSIKGRQTPSMLGQQPKEFDLNLEDRVNPMISGVRYIDSIKTNQRILDEKAKGLKEATLAKYRSPMQFIPSRNTLNAGEPYYEQAKRTIQSLPTVNSDYLAQAALDKMNKDHASAIKAQGDLAMAQQHTENLARLRQEKQAQAQHEWEVDNYNKDIKSAELAGLSDLKAGTMLGNYQSRQNLLHQIQTEWDQNRQMYNNIASAAAQNEARNKAYDWYQGQIKSHFGTTPIDMKNPAHYEFVTNAQRQVSDMITNAGYQAQTNTLSPYWKNKANTEIIIKSKNGSKLRSAEDQIKINRHKSVDQNWINSNKAVNKAIEKLNDRVHAILMKILSDEV